MQAREGQREGGREGERERERERERKFQTGSTLSVQSPTWCSIPQPWDHDLNQNQKSEFQPTEPPRHPGYAGFIDEHKESWWKR